MGTQLWGGRQLLTSTCGLQCGVPRRSGPRLPKTCSTNFRFCIAQRERGKCKILKQQWRLWKTELHCLYCGLGTVNPQETLRKTCISHDCPVDVAQPLDMSASTKFAPGGHRSEQKQLIMAGPIPAAEVRTESPGSSHIPVAPCSLTTNPHDHSRGSYSPWPFCNYRN